MSILKNALAKASRRHKDVHVVLDGELLAEREELAAAAVSPGVAARLGKNLSKEAQDALDAWDEEHKDSILVVRVRGCVGSEWNTLQLKNPVPKKAEDRTPTMVKYGFDLAGAVVDALMKFGQVVYDGEVEEPSEELWGELWEQLANPDREKIVHATIELNGTPSEQAFGDLLKASSLSHASATKSD